LPQILSSILNKFYSFNEPFGSAWTFWYIRESSTALIVANLPLTWTVFRRLFHLRSFDGSEYSKSRTGHHPGSTVTARSHGQLHGRSKTRSYTRQGDASDNDLAGSQEDITKGYGISLKIYQRHDVHVSSEPATKEDGRQASDESLPGGLITTVKGGGTPQSFLDDSEAASDKFYPPVKTNSGV
jgi:hypothetical protein